MKYIGVPIPPLQVAWCPRIIDGCWLVSFFLLQVLQNLLTENERRFTPTVCIDVITSIIITIPLGLSQLDFDTQTAIFKKEEDTQFILKIKKTKKVVFTFEEETEIVFDAQTL